MSVPNQNLIYLNRELIDMKCPKDSYLAVYWNNLENAMLQLKHSGLLVYLYLLKEVPHYYDHQINNKRYTKQPFEFSPSAISKQLNIARNSVMNGFKELLEKGFLKELNGNTYQFEELPPDQRISVWGITPEDYENIKQETPQEEKTVSAPRVPSQKQIPDKMQTAFGNLGIPTHLQK